MDNITNDTVKDLQLKVHWVKAVENDEIKEMVKISNEGTNLYQGQKAQMEQAVSNSNWKSAYGQCFEKWLFSILPKIIATNLFI